MTWNAPSKHKWDIHATCKEKRFIKQATDGHPFHAQTKQVWQPRTKRKNPSNQTNTNQVPQYMQLQDQANLVGTLGNKCARFFNMSEQYLKYNVYVNALTNNPETSATKHIPCTSTAIEATSWDPSFSTCKNGMAAFTKCNLFCQQSTMHFAALINGQTALCRPYDYERWHWSRWSEMLLGERPQ